MKIVHVDETFHPSFGYQINSLAKYQRMEGNEVWILTTDEKHLHPAFRFANDNDRILESDKEYQKSTGVKIIRLPVKKYISNRAIFCMDLYKKIKQLSPDVVMLHQIETFASIVYMLKRLYRKYPTVADSHMLRMSSGNKFAKIYNRCFRALITPRIIRNRIPVVRTQDDDYVNSVLRIPEPLTPFISFGSDQILFHRDNTVRDNFRKENGIPENAFVVVYTGKMDEAKGGQLLADAVKRRFITKSGREVVFVIVGNTYKNAYGEKVDKTFSESENRIIRFPTQRFVDLPEFYQAADLSIFARQCSLSFYDVQACGLPVVFEDNIINIARASHRNGLTFEAGNADDFRNKIQFFADMSPDEYSVFSDNAVSFINGEYGYDRIAEQYTELMVKAVQRFGRKKNGNK